MKDAICAVFIYDVNKKQTLENLSFWNEMFSQNQLPQAIKVLVGNKTDLNERKVTRKQGEDQALQYNAKHFQVSAKYGKRLDQLFNSIIDLITEQVGNNKSYMPAIEQAQMQKQLGTTLKIPSQKVDNSIRLEPEEPALQTKKRFCC